jgi:hypothetical protein
VKGWIHNVPNPASIAALYSSYKAYGAEMRGLAPPDFESCESQDKELLRWSRDCGKQIAAIAPKGSDELLPTASNQGAEYLRFQTSNYSRIIRSWESDCLVVDKITKWGITISLTKETDGLTFVSSIKDWGETPDASKDFVTLLLGELKFPRSAQEENSDCVLTSPEPLPAVQGPDGP